MYSFTNCGRLKQSDIKVIIPTFFFRYPGYPREYKRVSLVTNCRLFFKSNIKVKISFNFLHDFLISHFNCCDWKFFRILLEQNFGKNKLCLQINLCQKLLFLHQLTHNMTTDCSLIYQFSTWKFQAQNMGRKWWEHVVYTNCFFVFTFRTTYVSNMFYLSMFSPCSELGIFMYWTGEFNGQSFVILWVSWCKNKCFWQRFTCTKLQSCAKHPNDAYDCKR